MKSGVAALIEMRRQAAHQRVRIAAFKFEENEALDIAEWMCGMTRQWRSPLELLEAMKAGCVRVFGVRIIVKPVTTCQRPEAGK